MISQQPDSMTGAHPSWHTRSLSRRTLLQCAGAVGTGSLTASLLASCETSSPASGSLTLTVWDYFIDAGKDAGKGYLGLFDEYRRLNPKVSIQRTAVPFSDLTHKLILGGASGHSPDIAVIDNPVHSDLAANGILADITEKVKAWGKTNEYFVGSMHSTMWQGRYYGVPNNSNCLALYYNKDMLEAAGVAPPTNWEELRTTASKLTKSGVYGYCMALEKNEEGIFQFLPFLWEADADLATIDSPQAIGALDYLVGFIKDGFLSSESLNWTQLGATIQFIGQKAAMCLNGPWNYPHIKQEAQFRYSVVPIPRGRQEASILGGENWAITKRSPHIEEAWNFIKWTQEPRQIKDYTMLDLRLPSNKSIAQDPAFQADPNIAVFIKALEVARPRAYGSNYPKMSAALAEAIQAAGTGRMSSASALKRAGEIIKPLLPS